MNRFKRVIGMAVIAGVAAITQAAFAPKQSTSGVDLVHGQLITPRDFCAI